MHSDETGAEDRLGNCLLHITEMPSLPPLSATVNLATHTVRSLAPIAEAPSSPSAVPPPVHAVLACRSATQVSPPLTRGLFSAHMSLLTHTCTSV